MAQPPPKPAPPQPPLQKNPTFSAEYKQNTVNLILEQRLSLKAASQKLGISRPTLRSWIQQFSTAPTPQTSSTSVSLLAENQNLRAQLQRALEDVEFLKKATRYFARNSL